MSTGFLYADAAAADNGAMMRRPLIWIVLFVLLVLLVWGLAQAGWLAVLTDADRLRDIIHATGALGPVAVILLIAVAIIFSPLPSAPVGVASGAVFGHLWGWAYVVAGSVLGAAVAFSLARLLGREAVSRWLGQRVHAPRLEALCRSQWALMGAVFLSRLVPFISFDLVSYVAGLTPLQFWRFLVATVAGIAPISFALAHVGEEAASLEPGRVLAAVLLLGLLTGAPLLFRALRARFFFWK